MERFRGLPGALAFFIGLPLAFFIFVSGLITTGLSATTSIAITLVLTIAIGSLLAKRF